MGSQFLSVWRKEEPFSMCSDRTPVQQSVRARLTRREVLELAAAGAVGSLATSARGAVAATARPQSAAVLTNAAEPRPGARPRVAAMVTKPGM